MDFDVFNYFENKEALYKDIMKKADSVRLLQTIVKGDISCIEVHQSNTYLVMNDGRKYRWRINSVEDNNFTILTHTGIYENDEYLAISPLLHDLKVVFDIGANKGWYSILFARNMPQGTVYSFEPSCVAFEELQENIRANGLKNVQSYKKALSDFNGVASLFIPFGHAALASLAHQYDTDDFVKEDCQVTTLDLFCSTEGIDIIDFLKIDAEGSELNILHGAEKMLQSAKIRMILLESYDRLLHKFGVSSYDIVAYLKSKGYYARGFHNGKLVSLEEVDITDGNLFFTHQQ